MILFDKDYVTHIYYDASEPFCITNAVVSMLSNDFMKVCGKCAPTYNDILYPHEKGIIIGTLDNKKMRDTLSENDIDTSDICGKWEAFKLLIKNDCLFIIGSDCRGTMWGIFEFSEKYLGIDPLYQWTENEPEHMDSLELNQLDITDYPHTYKFRGWFINDEDLLEGFSKQEMPERGYRFHGDYMPALAMIVETGLRLKQNLLIPCSHLNILDPAEKALVKYITERGMFISMHHQEPVGVHQFTMDSYWREKDPTIENINFIDHPDKYREVWTKYIHEWAQFDNVIWQLGLRGRGDRPVWYNNPRAPETTEERGKLIGDAMQMQLDIIRSECPNKDIICSATLWMEGMPLYKERALKFPSDTIIVMSDFGPNQMWGEGYYTTPRFSDYNYGLYYHLAFWGCGPHIVQGNRPEKILFNYKGAVEAGDTHYSIINVSNFREHLYGIAYSSQITWNIENSDIEAFRRNWCKKQFKANDTSKLEEVYSEYFDSFYKMDNELIPGQMLLMDGMCKRVAWKLMSIIGGSELKKDDIQNTRLYNFDTTDEFIEYYKNATEESLPKFESLMEKAISAKENVTEDRKRFFDSNMIVHISMITGLYRWVNHLAKAAEIKRSNGSTVMFDENIREAVNWMNKAIKTRELARFGKWKHWYTGDRLMNLAGDSKATEELIEK